MKRKLGIAILIVITLIIAILFSIYYFCEKNTKSNDIYQKKDNEKSNIQVNHIDLYSKLSDYSQYSINVAHVYNDYIYGTIETDKYDLMLFSTVAVFTYNINSNEINIIPQTENKRIIEFYSDNNYVYYFYLLNNNDENFKWELNVYDLTTGKSKEILNGFISDVFEYPRIFAQEGNDIYIMMKNNGITKILQINGFDAKEIITIEDDIVTPYNMDTIKYKDNKIYYVVTEKDKKDCIKILDLDTKNIEVILKNESENHEIYTLNIINNKLIVQEAIESNFVNLITFNLDLKITENIVESQLLNFPEKLNNKNILFHQLGSIWKIYNVETGEIEEIEELKRAEMTKNGMFPKYFLIDDNRILVQDFSNDFYVINIYM